MPPCPAHVSSSRRLPWPHALAACGMIALAMPADARVDPACEPIVAATEAKIAAPAFHDRKQVGPVTLEMIRVGEELYANEGSGWRLVNRAASKALGGFRASLDAGTLTLSGCKKVGRETVGGRSTTVYEYTSAGGQTGTARVWVGDDGLPYRESSEEQEGTTTYVDVRAPAVAAEPR